MTKAWSAKNGIIRNADSDTVKRWVPSTGFAPEGRILQEPPKKKSSVPAPAAGQVGASDSTASSAAPASTAVPESEPIKKEVPLTPAEEALVSVAALRLLPDELESIRQQAFKEGEAEGYKRGHAEGIIEGKAAAESTFEARFNEAMVPRLKEAQAPILDVLHSMQEEIPKLDSVLAQQILDLAFVLAEQMTCRAIAFNPKIILSILDEAIHALPREARGWLQIYVHPKDAALLKEALAGHPNEQEQRIYEDPDIQRGGCRLVSRMGELDATLESRWKTLLKNLGREDSWLKLDEFGSEEPVAAVSVPAPAPEVPAPAAPKKPRAKKQPV